MYSKKNSAAEDYTTSMQTNFEDAFELTGFGKVNYLVLLASGLILLNVSMECLGMGYVITAAKCDLHLRSQDKGYANAAAFLGIVSTSIFWGYLSDKSGRRKVMMPALIASAILSIISSFSINIWMLSILRFLTGCLVSASCATVFAYLGEMYPAKRRATAMVWSSGLISFSFILLPGLAWATIGSKWSFSIGTFEIYSWRVFMCAWCVPGLVAAAILAFLPESPRYLLTAKGPEEALSVLAVMYAWNHNRDKSEFPTKKIIQAVAPDEPKSFCEMLKDFSLLFQQPLLRCGAIANVNMFAGYMISSGIYTWVPDILNDTFQGRSQSFTICEVIHTQFERNRNLTMSNSCRMEVSTAVFPISMAIGVSFIFVYLSIGLIVNKIGKKTLYFKAMSMCLMYMIGRLGASLSSYILGATLDKHCIPTFTSLGLFCFISTLLFLLWPNQNNVRSIMKERGYSY